MGNRKERRRAALSSTGRRVKLDLFAEPSGELGGSSANGSGGGDTDSIHSAGSPKLLSSDQPVKNPLLLLGQYSDDDEDEESNGRPTPAAGNSSPKDLSSQVAELKHKAGVTVSQDDPEDGSGNLKIATAGPNLIHKNSAPDHCMVSENLDLQVIGNVGSGWKIVRHEVTNQCYYWNVDTGETSWKVPKIISQIEEVTTAQKLLCSPEGINPPGTSGSGSVVDGFVNQDHSIIAEPSSNALHGAYASSFGSSLGAYYSYQQPDGNVSDWNNLTTSYGLVGKGVDENVCENDLSSRVLKFGEYLLERLQSLTGSSSDSDGQNWVSRYILEVEIRLSDIRSLISYGLALLPFWVHSEIKLRKMGEAFNFEASQLANANNVEVGCVSTVRGGSEKCKTTLKTERNEDLSSDIRDASVGIKIPEVFITHFVDGCINTEKMPAELAVNDADKLNEKLSVTSGSNQAPDDHVEDDVDMDVDMEVEEPMPAPCITLVEPAAQSSSLQKLSLFSETEPGIPHPPDEGWIPPPPSDEEMIPPPPPPDNENFPPPPPPPDDPPEPSVQPSPYSDPTYNVYTGYTYGYYDQTVAGVQVTEFHGQIAGYHVVTPHGEVFYEAPNSYVTNGPVIANSVETLLNYDPHSIQIQAPPVLNGASSGLCNGSGIESHYVVNETGSSCLESKVSTGVQNIDKGRRDSSFVIPTIQAQATVSTTADVSLPVTDNASIANTNVSKGLSKARGKKRISSAGPSMRSNKKVSTLVDKWKAAKEELQEDEEDEPEDSYEALEKKKQQEIEEWRAKQIASGEAKDNANFQPLGCDWRERVKRRRAQMKADVPQVSADDAKNGKQDPDLVKLAKGLPPGWQVHWDDSSKQVYYSNVNTSETTWIRPA